jgi:hypothetical protein
MALQPGGVVTPYISDPIKSGRNIVNSFRMHEVITAWSKVYQQITSGMSFADALVAL